MTEDKEKLSPIFTDSKLCPLHRATIEKMRVPKWMYNFTCIQCGEKLTPEAIRAIGLYLNAKEIGNFGIEIHCRLCNAGYTLHLIKACKTVADFIKILQFDERPFDEDKFVPDYELTGSNLIEDYIRTLPDQT